MQFKKILSKNITVDHIVSVILIVLSAFGISLAMFIIQPTGLGDIWICFRMGKFLPLLLNALPVLLFILLIYFITSNVVTSVWVAFTVVMLMSVVNRSKMLLRQSPFYHYDFKLIKEVLGVSQSFDKKLIALGLAGFILLVAALIIALRFIKTKKLHWIIRCVGCVVVIIISFVCNKQIYSRTGIFNSLYVQGNKYNQTDIFNSRGFLYSFIYNLNTVKLTAPEGYDRAKIRQLMDEPYSNPSVPEVKPHIIMIMSEAFTDLAINPRINFDGLTDPLYFYKQLTEDSINGYIVTPNLGGGTGDTEFDVLTGMNTRYLRGAPYSYLLVNKPTDSLASLLKGVGYNATAIHPGHSWFYNRKNVYRYFGFDNFISLEDFEGEPLRGAGYMNETSTIDRVIEVYEDNRENGGGKPIFDFCVTIQNHGPYNKKYDAETNFNTDLPLSEDDVDAISNYFEGLADADRELQRLVEYMSLQDEPVVLVYFGDHLPAFSADSQKYLPPLPADKTDDDISVKIRLYKTPFLIWQNDAARKVTQIESNYEAMGLSGKETVITPNYLGVILTELLGFNNLSRFFDYVGSLWNDYPITLENWYIDADNNVVDMPSDTGAVNKPLHTYRSWQYYMIKD